MTSILPKHFDVVDDDMAEVLGQKTEAERLAIAHRMWSHARQMLWHILRDEFPAWSEAEVNRETARRLSHGAA